MKTTRIGFLGGGNMAGALISGLLASKAVRSDQLRVTDPRPGRLAELNADHGIDALASNSELVRWASVIVLAVKPQVLPSVLSECGALMGSGHLVVSLVAGVPIRAIESHVGAGTRVVRAMPNTAALARASATAVASGTSATDADLDVARALFDAVGKTVVLIEALADGGVKVGLPRDVALLLAAQTVQGAAKLLIDSGEHPARLKDMVTSPGGTTIAGVSVLEAAGVRGSIMAAVEAATLRAAELGKRA
jgi:pyrroline-5-carboxylate reductase